VGVVKPGLETEMPVETVEKAQAKVERIFREGRPGSWKIEAFIFVVAIIKSGS
jgi:hypothetical protein